MINLDAFQTTIEVQYQGKKYQIQKVLETERNIINEITSYNTDDPKLFEAVSDFVFKKLADADFPTEEFKKTATVEMISELFQAIVGSNKDDKKKDK